MINSTGNSAKSLTTSVHTSLENLQTDYIDIVSAVHREMERDLLDNGICWLTLSLSHSCMSTGGIRRPTSPSSCSR